MGGRLTEQALEVLRYRYLRDIITGDGETTRKELPSEMFERVAKQVASVERPEYRSEWTGKFESLISSLRFLPNTPCLANAGTVINQLLGCFVIPIGDSTEEIFYAVRAAALVQKGGGGTGFSFSRLRPAGSTVMATNGVASGPVSFLRVFDAVTREMKQGGIRRGANMGILRCDHPDIDDFLECKKKEGDVENFNISVAITDEFMTALEAGDKYPLRFKGQEYDRVYAGRIWEKIARGAWENGEPGVIFIDRINDSNPLKGMGEVIESVNPCGEEPLPPWGSCNLGSMDVSRYIVDGLLSESRLRKDVAVAVRFLDDVIDASTYPLREIEREAFSKRRIGLGIMGLHDAMLSLGIDYRSEDALQFASDVMKLISRSASETSEALYEEKGTSRELQGFYKTQDCTPRRNGTLTTIAPTGSLSLIAGCSSGCEPVFSYLYKKKCLDGEIDVVHPSVPDGMSVENLPSHFVTATDVSIEQHIMMQSVLQKHVDASISKTINAPASTTEEQVDKAFRLSFESGCKSVSLYRDGSRTVQALVSSVLSPTPSISEVFPPPQEKETEELELSEKDNDEKEVNFDSVDISTNGDRLYRKRPSILHGETRKIETHRGTLYVTMNRDENGIPIETFVQLGKSGMEIYALCEALGRLVSLCFRYGIGIESVVRQLQHIGSDGVTFESGRKLTSIPDAVAFVLGEMNEQREHVGEIGESTVGVISDECTDFADPCPSCGDPNLIVEGRCVVCKSCGWTRC